MFIINNLIEDAYKKAFVEYNDLNSNKKIILKEFRPFLIYNIILNIISIIKNNKIYCFAFIKNKFNEFQFFSYSNVSNIIKKLNLYLPIKIFIFDDDIEISENIADEIVLQKKNKFKNFNKFLNWLEKSNIKTDNFKSIDFYRIFF